MEVLTTPKGSDISTSGKSKAKHNDTIPPALPLPPVPADASLPGDQLCSACAGLRLTARRFIVFPEDREYGQLTGQKSLPVFHQTVAEARDKFNCPLCRLLLVSLAGGNGHVPAVDRQGRAIKIALGWGENGPVESGDMPWAKRSAIRILYPSLAVDGAPYPDIDMLSIAVFPEITLLTNDAPPDSPDTAIPFLPRPVSDCAIDFNHVRRWLSICATKHHAVCNSSHVMTQMAWESPARAVPAFRCIDLESNCLVLLRDFAEATTQYAALSYVWGSAKSDDDFFKTLRSNVAARSKQGFFARPENQARLPRTIADAMSVVRQIGLRYLWVDSLCIVQDGQGEDWLDAIRKMDIVYGAADIVICASGSHNAFIGIDGVSNARERAGRARNIEQIAEDFRLAFLFADQLDPEKPPYSTRGWTYQEEHFAYRRLIFEKGTVKFRCRGGILFTESRFDDLSEVSEAPPQFSRGEHTGQDNDIYEFEVLFSNYTERKLTKETDVYRAFAGVGRQIQQRLSSDLCHGLPSRFFDWFLLWHPVRSEKDTAPLKRRLEAPSWSWAGWRGAVWARIWDWFTGDIKVVKREIRRRTWIIWYQRVDHNSLEFVPIRRHGRRKEHGYEARNFYGGRCTKLKRFPGIDCSVTDPTPRVLGRATGIPTYEIDLISEKPGSGFLQFWTISAVFELRIVGAGDDGIYGEPERSSLGSPASSNLAWSSESASDEWFETYQYEGEAENMLPPNPDDYVKAEMNELDEIDKANKLMSEFEQDAELGAKLVIGDQSGRAIGRIHVPSEWKETQDFNDKAGIGRQYEFIVLCEARDAGAQDQNKMETDGGWRYRVMLVDSKCDGQYYERVAIGSVGLHDLKYAVRPLEWKEFVLG